MKGIVEKGKRHKNLNYDNKTNCSSNYHSEKKGEQKIIGADCVGDQK